MARFSGDRYSEGALAVYDSRSGSFKIIMICQPVQLSLLLPMPMLLFAWLSACSNAFAWHLTPMGNSKFQHYLRFKPMVLNLITWITPFAVFAVNLVLVIIWPILQSDAKGLRKSLSKFGNTASYHSENAILIH
jgi:hypothetical protein